MDPADIVSKSISMKRIASIVLASLIISTSCLAQELSIGNTIPELLFENAFVNGKPDVMVKNLSTTSYKGKIILIDFWATWCGPCIQALSKYEKLQASQKGHLQIITVTNEKAERIKKFLQNKKVDLLMAIDTAERLRKLFPYYTIPHVVLIDGKGKIRAITHSDEITDSVIKRVYEGKDISLSLKKDDTKFDYEADFFKADSSVQTSFNMQPGIEGVGTFSKTGKGVFENRRISMHNFTIDGLYRMAYQLSHFRIVYDMDKKEFDYNKNENKYCLDVIVPKGKEASLYKTIQNELPHFFDIKVRFEKRKMPVFIIRRNDSTLHLKKSKETNNDYTGSSNFFTGNGVKISALADFLESFGLFGTPVLDETGIEGHYDIHMEWEPEKKGHLRAVFLENGFIIEKQEREVEVMVIYK